ncbi:LigA protein [Streptomyces noursei ZPM]|uniref:Uncharacterized protein n=2 Tax=Streptomyces noursei TaxID=1971 RepID=A0A059VY26_STRNR|nr:hypothetical protein DC74_1422 [Streptomyces noursei]AKA02300.1 LigA protein [Streptomyces noursei ZPM]EPY92660.1 hypothetical protein K530_52175 [Streptomyces noursei CCRC 11814]GCB89551.1 hypothetical protein SALB_02239 [Streptomyces noursei]
MCGTSTVPAESATRADHNALMTDDWKRQIDRLHRELVRRDDPTEWVVEADAVDASRRYPDLALRGPVFGVAVRTPADPPQDPERTAEWRLLKPVADDTPQGARDTLNSHLWFTAKDDTDDPAVRRELLAAVTRLEHEPLDDLTVCGARYRIVRGDEFVRTGRTGLEPPRPTDPEPAARTWEGRSDPPSPDLDFALVPGRETSPMAAAMKVALQGFAYPGEGFPTAVREESERARTDYPDVVLLPVGFGVAERRSGGWQPRGALMPTPHAARRLLADAMVEFWPGLYEFSDDEREQYARAADAFKAAGRANDVRVGDRAFQICRIERMVRTGPDGPEPPRPSDVDDYGPTQIHPTMDEDGTLHYDS